MGLVNHPHIWDGTRLAGHEEMSRSLTNGEDQVVAVSLGKKTFSGETKLLKHHKDHPCLQDLVVLDALEAANQFWDVPVLSKNYFFFIHVGILTLIVTWLMVFLSSSCANPDLGMR